LRAFAVVDDAQTIVYRIHRVDKLFLLLIIFS
jgi:hypothetical protein